MQDEELAVILLLGLIVLAAVIRDLGKFTYILSIFANVVLLFTIIKKSSERGWFTKFKETFDSLNGVYDSFAYSDPGAELVYPNSGIATQRPTGQLGPHSGDRLSRNWQPRTAAPLAGGYRNQADLLTSTRYNVSDRSCMGERNLDTMNTMYWKKKGDREKQAIDGAHSRTRDQLLKYGYEEECARSENRVWWGEDDF